VPAPAKLRALPVTARPARMLGKRDVRSCEGSRTPRCWTLPTRGRSASERHQGTKSREVEHARCSGRYGVARQRAPNLPIEIDTTSKTVTQAFRSEVVEPKAIHAESGRKRLGQNNSDHKVNHAVG
jgi:hypothetical protein